MCVFVCTVRLPISVRTGENRRATCTEHSEVSLDIMGSSGGQIRSVLQAVGDPSISSQEPSFKLWRKIMGEHLKMHLLFIFLLRQLSLAPFL